ncbi:MAG TPA: 2-oxoacid:ferredoxin oxidoreductase subunit beta [Methanothermobacter sp.]|nr:2-oxoglutarate synthase, subunit beta [Methanothermobacter sp. MT-2]HHW05443.1 2-oxoacid:ferredoxin oxidoreductase subunit beta [Methanothermobacter sp.]HOK73221.1 2-oxoacid:ferredoxin oxidoreductase subunit beta [Methanothermobacter sp.]HOL68831.1 2-oxoacid:ferredoxin oxidoreductase subunit beta [Methanothermobacter sp.]HPQ04724.1 2-oxoacid:ferredoxin oxidoreductase subunit beta [Methanothermobacter sp.]
MTLENPFLKYLRKDRLPHIFCAGCGNGIVMNTFFKGLELANLDFKNIVMVSGIGCSSRIPGYVKCDSLHTTHGRPIAFATGLKLGNPKLDVVVFTGDGDAAAIGGNHLIHGARRNIDLTVICINNNIYGMTGGQISPTSPRGSYGSTAPYGALETPFNLAELVKAAGASYVARWTTAHPLQLANSIRRGFENKGFSFIEVLSQCPTYFGRKNRMRTPVEMLLWMKDNSVNRRKALRMEPEELEGKIIVGDFINEEKEELTTVIYDLIEERSGERFKSIKSAYKG